MKDKKVFTQRQVEIIAKAAIAGTLEQLAIQLSMGKKTRQQIIDGLVKMAKGLKKEIEVEELLNKTLEP